jgi:hypothetical protein
LADVDDAAGAVLLGPSVIILAVLVDARLVRKAAVGELLHQRGVAAAGLLDVGVVVAALIDGRQVVVAGL